MIYLHSDWRQAIVDQRIANNAIDGFDTLNGTAQNSDSDELGFEWSSCDYCDTGLGGDRYALTLFNPTTKEATADKCCIDCRMYIAYGDIPE